MYTHHTIKSLILLLAFSFFPFVAKSDDDSIGDRNRVASRRNERFFKNDLVRHFISLSGEYDSDENSKQKILKLDHFYKSKRWISDIEFRMETLYENVSTTYSVNGKQHLEKESDEYKAIVAEKIVLFDTNNYFLLFNETRYDDESDSSYYDITTAAGFGRMFFNDQLEIDFGYGVSRAKNITDTVFEGARRSYNRQILVPAFRAEFLLFDKVRFLQRAYAFYSDKIDSYYFLTRLQYPLSQRVYLQVSHYFDKRSYDLYDNKTMNYLTRRNEIRRQILLGFRFDFGKGN
jgi:hypothetical protein